MVLLYKYKRLHSDLSKAVYVLSGLDNSIQSPSIRDTFRLGKFSTYHHNRPTPLLVKFVRAADASSVLSKRSLLSNPIVIKPDLTPEERQRGSILLKERWTLIYSQVFLVTQSGFVTHVYLLRISYLVKLII